MKAPLLAVALAAVGAMPAAYAAGDLSRNNPQEIVLEMGSSGSKMYFKPDHLNLETGKAYKLVLKNVDKINHELESPELVERIFTRKVEVADMNDHMVAEIKGNIREIEVGPGGTAEWFFVPVQSGEDIPIACAITGHAEAGMVGTVTIK